MTRRHSASESPHKTKRQSFFKKEESGPSSANSSSGEEENETPFYKNSRMRMDNYDNKSKRQSFPFARGRGYVKRPFFRHHGGGQTHYYPNPHNRRQHNYNSYDKSHQRHGSASPSPENKHSRRRRSYNHSGESRHHNESESSRYDKSISYQDKPSHKFDRSPSPSPSPARPRLASTVQKRGDSQEQRKRSSSRPSRSESRPSRSVSRPSRIDTRPGRADKHPKSNSSSPSSGPDIETTSAARRKRFVFLPDANSASQPLTATNMASPGGLSFNSGVASSGPKREEGELTDSDSVTSEKRRAIADIEEKSIENRLKNLDKKRGNIPEKVSKEALEAAEFEEEIENLDRRGGETELKSQVGLSSYIFLIEGKPYL